ncbi:hypothetical protein Shyd_56790 [Streptomyces hydrogenans]|uniref:Transposase n=1 Tax=Streptomyces hydrogenans TaxID=1873719 RepID=A0ABQ3PH10_9ACTN|nr:hypothetical protein Shyd_56790 [Streptomyces hydrogenans]
MHKYINQGRAGAARSHVFPRRLARMILARPDKLKAEHRGPLARLTAACPEMTHLHAFTGAWDRDRDAVIAALTLPLQQRPHQRLQHQGPNGSRARCTDEQAPPFFATASSSDSGTLRHHRT